MFKLEAMGIKYWSIQKLSQAEAIHKFNLKNGSFLSRLILRKSWYEHTFRVNLNRIPKALLNYKLKDIEAQENPKQDGQLISVEKATLYRVSSLT
jgi:hypothetical protein